MVSATSAVASRARGPGTEEPTTTKSTPLERVSEPVDGLVTLSVSAEGGALSVDNYEPGGANTN